MGSPPDVETNISPNEHESNGSIIIDGSITTKKIGKLKSKIILKINKGLIVDFYSKSKSLEKRFKNIFHRQNKKRRFLAEIGFGFNKKVKSPVTCSAMKELSVACIWIWLKLYSWRENKIDFHLDMVLKSPQFTSMKN